MHPRAPLIWYKQKWILFKLEWIFLIRCSLVSQSRKDLQSATVSEWVISAIALQTQGTSWVRVCLPVQKLIFFIIYFFFLQVLEERHHCRDWSALLWSGGGHSWAAVAPCDPTGWFKWKAFTASLVVSCHKSNTLVGFTVHQKKWETEMGKCMFNFVFQDRIFILDNTRIS